MRKMALAPALFLAMIQIGCVITKIESTKPGLFGDNSAAMLEAFNKVKIGQAMAEVEEIGFNFSASHNIDRPQGVSAIDRLFPGSLNEFLRGSILDDSHKADEKIDQVTKALNPYRLYVVPYKHVVTERDRFYISRQDTFRNGEILMMYFLFKESTLTYVTNDYKKINEKETEKAFLKGLFDLFGGAGGAYDGYRDYQDRKKD